MEASSGEVASLAEILSALGDFGGVRVEDGGGRIAEKSVAAVLASCCIDALVDRHRWRHVDDIAIFLAKESTLLTSFLIMKYPETLLLCTQSCFLFPSMRNSELVIHRLH